MSRDTKGSRYSVQYVLQRSARSLLEIADWNE